MASGGTNHTAYHVGTEAERAILFPRLDFPYDKRLQKEGEGLGQARVSRGKEGKAGERREKQGKGGKSRGKEGRDIMHQRKRSTGKTPMAINESDGCGSKPFRRLTSLSFEGHLAPGRWLATALFYLRKNESIRKGLAQERLLRVYLKHLAALVLDADCKVDMRFVARLLPIHCRRKVHQMMVKKGTLRVDPLKSRANPYIIAPDDEENQVFRFRAAFRIGF